MPQARDDAGLDEDDDAKVQALVEKQDAEQRSNAAKRRSLAVRSHSQPAGAAAARSASADGAEGRRGERRDKSTGGDASARGGGPDATACESSARNCGGKGECACVCVRPRPVLLMSMPRLICPRPVLLMSIP